MTLIWHIDDSPTVAKAVSLELEPLGYQVTHISNYISLMSSKKFPISLFILDLQMPSLKGETIGEYIRKYHDNIPVIIFSGETPERLDSARKMIFAQGAIRKDGKEGLNQLKNMVQKCVPKGRQEF